MRYLSTVLPHPGIPCSQRNDFGDLSQAVNSAHPRNQAPVVGSCFSQAAKWFEQGSTAEYQSITLLSSSSEILEHLENAKTVHIYFVYAPILIAAKNSPNALTSLCMATDKALIFLLALYGTGVMIAETHVLSAFRAKLHVAFCALIISSDLCVSFSFSGHTRVFPSPLRPVSGSDSFDSRFCSSVRHFCRGPSRVFNSLSRFDNRTSPGTFALRARSSRARSTLLRLFSSSIILLVSFRPSLMLWRYR